MSFLPFLPLGGLAVIASTLPVAAQTPPGTVPAPVAQATPSPVHGTERAEPAHRPGHKAKRRKASRAESGVAVATRAATREPIAAGFVNAVQIYPYAEGTLYQLYAAPERVTDIALQPGEALVSVAAGDTARWVIGDTTSGTGAGKRTHILVKPFSAGLSTNLVVSTDRRSYHLALRSTTGTAMVAVSWTYPRDALLALVREEAMQKAAAPVASGLVPEQLRFDYAITGDRPPWRPLRAFDDGRQTYVEFPANLSAGEAPPLFLVDARGDVQLVNYRLHGRFYIVDRIFEAAELRLGLRKQDVVRITRTDVSARRKGS